MLGLGACSVEAVSTDFVSTVKDFEAGALEYLGHHNSIAAGELGRRAAQFADGQRTSTLRGVGGRLVAGATADRRVQSAFRDRSCC